MDGNSTRFKALTHTMGGGSIRSRGLLQQSSFRVATLPSCTEIQKVASAEGQAILAPHLATSPHSPKPLSLTKEVGGLTSPAGPNHERRFPPRWMDETIVMDESGVKGDAVGIECDCRELEIQGIVVPLVVTDLGCSVRAGAPQ